MIRKIEVNIDAKGKVKSSSDSFLGVCGETNASEICFILCDELINAIKQTAHDKEVFYRFEVTDAQNRRFVLENTSFADKKSFSLNITNAFTEYDGKITVALVIESEDFTLCTVPVDLRIEKSCTGTPNNQEVYSTIVTLFEQAEKQITAELEKSAEMCETAQVTADKILGEATAQAESIKTSTVNAANVILSEINSVCENATSKMNSLVQANNAIFTECEQRKVAAETAAVNAISAANSASQSKQQAEELLNTKENVDNKETNLKQDFLPDHTKYASARATQEYVSSFANWFGSELVNTSQRLEGLKADKSELEAVMQELANAKKEIDRLKTAENFNLIGNITCDGKTSEFNIQNLPSLKKIYIWVNLPSTLTEDIGNFNIYVNTFTEIGNALIETKAKADTKYFRLYSERIAGNVWKTETSNFSKTVYDCNWMSNYDLSNINYITDFKISCGDGTTKFLPQGTKIKIYGVKSLN